VDIKQGDALYPLIFNVDLFYVTRKSENQEELEKKDKINQVVIYDMLICWRRMYVPYRITKKLSYR
jgi:hypothetical protein